MAVNWGAVTGGGGASAPAPASTGGGVGFGGSQKSAAGGKIDWGGWANNYVKKQQNDAVISGLNDIGSGKSQLGYNDQVNTINDAAKKGFISHDDQIKLINAAVDHSNPVLGTSFMDNVGAAADAVKAVTIDPIANNIQTLYKQAAIGGEATKGIPQSVVDNQNKFLDSQVQAGNISQQDANARKAANQKLADINNAAVSAEEQKQGVKKDQGAGVGALLDLATTADVAKIPFDIAKSIAEKKAAGAAASLVEGVSGGGGAAPATMGNTATQKVVTDLAPTPQGAKTMAVSATPGKSVSMAVPKAYGGTGTVNPLPFGDAATATTKTGATLAKDTGAPNAADSMLARIPTAAAGDLKAADGANRFVNHSYNVLQDKIATAANKLTPEDKALMPQIESEKPMTPTEAQQRIDTVSKQAKDPQAFKDAAAALRDGYDAIHANDTHLGRDVAYRQNYLARIYAHPGDTTPMGKALNDLRANNPDTPGYSNSRTIATQDEAKALAAMKNPDGTPKYPNLQLKNANVFEDAQQRLSSAARDHSEQAIKQALQDAHPGVTIGRGNGGTFDPTSGSTLRNLKIPGAENLTAPEGIAKAYGNKLSAPGVHDAFGIKMKDGSIMPIKDNEIVQKLKETGGQLVDPVTGKSLHSNAVSRAVRFATNHPVATYDAINQNLKYSILGGGTFHAVTTAGSVGGQQLMNGIAHPLKTLSNLADNAKLVAGTLSPAQHEANMAAHEADGSLGFAHMVGTTLSDKEITADATSGIVDKMKDSNLNPIKQVHDMVFQRQIPEAKLMLIKQGMENKFGPNVDYHHPTPEMVQYGQKLASGANKLGGMNRTQGGTVAQGNWTMSPQVAKWVSRVGLAPDFTEGKFRTIFSAANLSKWGPEQNMARQMIIGKSVLFALPGLAAATAAGKIDWGNPQSFGKAIADQLLDPSISLNEKGPATKSNPNGTDQAIHFPSTFISEIGKIVKPALDPLAPNKAQGLIDYATNRGAAGIGVASRLAQNKDFFGNPIYGQDKMGNDISPGQAALNVANQVAPIPLVQGGKALNGQSLRDSALNVAGFRVSTDTNGASGQHNQAVSDFYNVFHSAEGAKSKATSQVNNLVSSGNIQQAMRVANEYNQSIADRLQPFKDKYAGNYNPAWDREFKMLTIPVSPGSIKGKIKAEALKQSVISPNY